MKSLVVKSTKRNKITTPIGPPHWNGRYPKSSGFKVLLLSSDLHTGSRCIFFAKTPNKNQLLLMVCENIFFELDENEFALAISELFQFVSFSNDPDCFNIKFISCPLDLLVPVTPYKYSC